MKRYILLLLLLCSFIHVDAIKPKVTVESLTPFEVIPGEGLSAFFSGVLDGKSIIAGGSNFPDTPCAEGGKKKYYREIYTLQEDGSWLKTRILPYSCANGASVTTPYGIFCCGGDDGTKLHDEAFLLTDSIIQFPHLPVPLKEQSVAYGKDAVYVVGGMSTEAPNRLVWKLSLNNPNAQWELVATLPDGSRLQPIAIIQTGPNGLSLYIMSGYTQGKTAIVRNDCLALDLSTKQWKKIASIPEGSNLTGGCATTSGYSHILCIGGINKQVFENRLNDEKPTADYFLHNAEWYKFNKKAWIYHTITDSWYPIVESDYFAKAGAAIVPYYKNSWLILQGEEKPGVRSPQITKLSIEHERSFGWINWTILVVYLLSMLLLGYIFMKRENGADDFFKGGGRIPWWAAGMSIYATMLSALTYMGIPAKSYTMNWTYYPILVTIVLVSIPVIKYYLPYFRRLNITSAYEYLEIRFNAATRYLASGLFIIFMIARMALVLYLPSLALNAVTGINIELCIVLMGIVTIAYCTMGGVEAVVWGDVIQGFILVGGAIFLAVWLIMHTEGGTGGFIKTAQDYHKFKLFEWSLDYRSVTFWVAIIGGIANNLISYTSDQTVIQRYLTTRDEKSAARSITMNALMCVFVSVVFYVIGTGLFTFFHSHPEELDISMDKGDAILPYFMMAEMPSGIAGLLIAAIFAATMSTISSNINSVSTAFSVDFWKKIFPHTSDKSMLSVARYASFVSGVIGVVLALIMASWNILSLIDYFNTILGLLTGGLGGLFFIGVFMPKVGGRAALIGFTMGTAFVFWMTYFTDANLFLYGASGIAVSVLVAWLLSMIWPENAKRIQL